MHQPNINNIIRIVGLHKLNNKWHFSLSAAFDVTAQHSRQRRVAVRQSALSWCHSLGIYSSGDWLLANAHGPPWGNM